MSHHLPTEDFYDKIKPGLHRRIGRELRLAGHVLDLGCGSCTLVQYLTQTYHQKVTGVDISSESFPKKRTGFDGKRFHCISADASHLRFVSNESIDAVVIMWALHEMTRPQAILKEAHRVLRIGGEVLIVDFPRDSLAQEKWHEKYFSPDEIEDKLVKSGFRDIRVKLIELKQIIWARGFRPIKEKGSV